MPKSLNNSFFPALKRIVQDNDSYCGPAVLAMLFDYWKIQFAQNDFVEAADVKKKIKKHGMTVEEMALSVRKLTPEFRFWYKRNSNLDEMAKIVNEYQIPVGIEWQGLFSNEEVDEDSIDDDPGHYSVVTKIDLKKGFIWIADPYKTYAGKDRRFTILGFERRWWDINEVVNPVTRRRKEVDDYHALFIIVPKEFLFPVELEMNCFE